MIIVNRRQFLCMAGTAAGMGLRHPVAAQDIRPNLLAWQLSETRVRLTHASGMYVFPAENRLELRPAPFTWALVPSRYRADYAYRPAGQPPTAEEKVPVDLHGYRIVDSAGERCWTAPDRAGRLSLEPIDQATAATVRDTQLFAFEAGAQDSVVIYHAAYLAYHAAMRTLPTIRDAAYYVGYSQGQLTCDETSDTASRFTVEAAPAKPAARQR